MKSAFVAFAIVVGVVNTEYVGTPNYYAPAGLHHAHGHYAFR